MIDLLDMRPEKVKALLGSKSRVCLLNSKDILSILKHEKMILMACNTRIKLVIPGIMRAADEMDAVVGFELAKSEGDLDGGYTGMNPELYFKTVTEYADEIGFTKPFFIHGDHITVKNASDKEKEGARALINAELEAGYTSFAIDASFNELPVNIEITAELSEPIVKEGYGLEVEVGEIRPAGTEGALTTVEEAREFIEGLWERGVKPDLLAINNGSKHGNYRPGEEIHIDLQRTGEIYDVVKRYGVSIAQHGITGTPLHLVGRFADFGIRKGNVGTHWQNIVHKHLPRDLMERMKVWCEERGKDIKFASKPFKEEIDNIPEENRKRIEEEAYLTAKEFIVAFKAAGTATLLKEGLRKKK